MCLITTEGNISVHFSSKSNEWETPIELFEKLNREFNFTLDAAATADNAKCARFFTLEDDSLNQSWEGETVWLNPPYGRTIGVWVRKAFEEAQNGAIVVCLIPARTDTTWFHDYCFKAEVRFIRGRVRFNGHIYTAPFPSAIIVFRKENVGVTQSSKVLDFIGQPIQRPMQKRLF